MKAMRKATGIGHQALRSSNCYSHRLNRPYLFQRRCGTRHYVSSTEQLPRVAQPSLWHSVVPKFLREGKKQDISIGPQRSKEWNPATFFIVMFLLIGSNAIQMINLRSELTTLSRKADAKIGLLKEVIERVQRGEKVDVAGLLGTGNEEQEKEWEEVLQEIEMDNVLWQTKAEKKAKKAAAAEERNKAAKEHGQQTSEMCKPLDGSRPAMDNTATTTGSETKSQKRPIGFY